MRKTCLFLPIFFVALWPIALHAQAAIYASAEITNYGYSSSVDGNFAYAPGTGHFSYYDDGGGISGGFVYLVRSDSRLKVGADVRGMYSPGSRGGAGGFGALRIAFVPREHAAIPYFQIGGGLLTTTYASSQANPSGGRGRVTSGAAELDVGLDVRTGSRFTIKAIELGGYAGSNVGHASIGAGLSYSLTK
jgi:hypothetical protein